MGAPTPTGIWYNRFRKREEQRSFYWALLASGLFHLSMVTVFSIVIYFPREDTVFYDFEIVPLSAADPASTVAAGAAEGLPDLAGGEKLALRGALPALELPTLEFAELARLRVRQAGVQSLSRYEDIFKDEPSDSWGRFSRGLTGMTRSLSKLRLSGGDDYDDDHLSSVLEGEHRPPKPIVHRPAEGFEAQLVWSSAPRDRQLLFSPPIEALWGSDPALLQRPVELIIQVNALGRVVNVFSPTVDERELVDAIQMTALQYRFEPLEVDDGKNQTATLRIQREDSGVTP